MTNGKRQLIPQGEMQAGKHWSSSVALGRQWGLPQMVSPAVSNVFAESDTDTDVQLYSDVPGAAPSTITRGKGKQLFKHGINSWGERWIRAEIQADFLQLYFYFLHFVFPMGISPMGNSGRFPPRKASCNRVALANPS